MTRGSSPRWRATGGPTSPEHAPAVEWLRQSRFTNLPVIAKIAPPPGADHSTKSSSRIAVNSPGPEFNEHAGLYFLRVTVHLTRPEFPLGQRSFDAVPLFDGGTYAVHMLYAAVDADDDPDRDGYECRPGCLRVDFRHKIFRVRVVVYAHRIRTFGRSIASIDHLVQAEPKDIQLFTR